MKTHLRLKDSKGNCYNAYKMQYNSSMSSGYQLHVDLEFDQDECVEKAQKLLGEVISCQLFSSADCKGEPLLSRSGVVYQISQSPFNHGYLQLIAVPFITLLDHSNRFRIFQKKSTADIVKAVLDEDGFSGCYEMGKLSKVKRDFCLQFNESDGDFIKRLLSEEGIHYFEKHEKDKVKIMFHDASLPFKCDQVVKLATANKPDITCARLSDWQHNLQFHGQQLQLGNWDEVKGKRVASKKLKSVYPNGSNKKLLYHYYPAAMVGDKCDNDTANTLAKKRMLQQEAEHQIFQGTTDSYQIAVGQIIEVKSSGKYLVTGVQETFVINDNRGGSYHCKFDCINEDQRCLPELIAKPQLNTVQSAVVVGSNKAKPNQDKTGRVRVKFHWDTTEGDKTSCWLRVAQLMAGKNYGLQFIPREGQEVLVTFLEGDPDKPMITGCVYNEQQPLPDAKANTTVSTIRTQLDGKANEIAFDDKKDAEKLSFNAGRDFEVTVGKDAKCTVVGESTTKVSKKFTMVLEDDAEIKVTKKTEITSKTFTLTAEDEIKLIVGDNQIIINKEGIELKAKKIQNTAEDGFSVKAKSVDLEASDGLTAKAKDITQEASGKISLTSNQAMSFDSKNKITLSSLQDMGLTAKAGQLKAEGKLGASLKGLKVDIAGQAMTNIKGALVKIN